MPEGGQLPPNSPPARNPPPAGGGGPGAIIVAVIATLLVVGAGTGLAVWFGGLTFGHPPSSQQADSGPAETQFQDEVAAGPASSTELINEWRAARSDHRIIARLIDKCIEPNADTISTKAFSVLLMDLRPDGDHYWRRAQQQQPGSDEKPAPAQLQSLTSYEGAILGISDAIARARVQAASGADTFEPFMTGFGWASVIVSAVATMLVTLRASADDKADQNSGRNWTRITIGVLAVLFSTTATVLAGAKQFWDPTAAYVRNEAALLNLKQLHTDVVLTFLDDWNASKCAAPTNSTGALDTEQAGDFKRWRTSLISLQSGTMHATLTLPTQNGSSDSGHN